MSKIGSSLFPLVLLSLLCPAASFAQNAAPAPTAPMSGAPADWTTWGYDQERTAWNRGETRLGKNNVAKLKLLWSAQVSTPPTDMALSTLTAPLVMQGVSTSRGMKDMVFLLGADDTLFALDADTGKTVWQKTFTNPIPAQRDATWLCPNTANDTPVIDRRKGIIYFIPSDGKLRGLSVVDGSEKLQPVDAITPFARAWSLNLIGDIIYTSSGRACGEILDPNSDWAHAADALGGSLTPPAPGGPAIDPSGVTAIDLHDPAHPQVTHFFTSGARAAGPWGRGGPVRGPNDSIIFDTSDGLFDPGTGRWNDTLLRLAPRATRVLDSYTPTSHQYVGTHDLGGSANPTIFPFGGKTLVAYGQKEGILRLLDAADLGGPPPDHNVPLYQSPQLGNDAASSTDPGQGIWGGVTTALTPDGRRFLYIPMSGPPSKDTLPFAHNGNGPTPAGSIMAYQVAGTAEKPVLVGQWMSPNLVMPDPPVVANGVVYATSTGGQAMQNYAVKGGPRFNAMTDGAHFRATPVGNLVLYAMDAETGKVLYSSKAIIPNWVHFSEPVVALGKVFLATHDAHVYAFGIK